MKRKTASLIKLKFVLIGLLLSVTSSYAQTVTEKKTSELPGWLENPTLFVIAGSLLILVIAIIALANTVITLSKAVGEVKKKSAATILLLLLSVSAFSQTELATREKATELPAWTSNPDVYLLGFLFFIIILTVSVLYNVNMKLIKTIAPEAVKKERAAKAIAVAAERKPTFLRRIYLRLVDSVPVAKEKDILLDHDYDGIRELDNNLPPWWKYGFYVTIIFAFFYLLIYHVSGVGKLQGEEYKDELLLAQKQKEERMKASADNVNEENVIALTDAELVGKGKETFQKLCVACHRPDGGGQVGPNLTDEYWLHGGGVKNIFKTITYGVPNKGMINWQSQLSPKQIQQVSSYILTLEGTNPAEAKEPQGDKWEEETAAPADSSATVKANSDSAMVASVDTLKK